MLNIVDNNTITIGGGVTAQQQVDYSSYDDAIINFTSSYDDYNYDDLYYSNQEDSNDYHEMRKSDFIIPMITAPISLFSSIYLIYTILQKRQRRQYRKSKEQLLLGLSLLDICGSFAWSFSTLPGPYWINSYYPTIGNHTTCQIQGFFVQLCIIGVPMYNASICIYYLLTVKYTTQVRSTTIQKYILPTMHAVVWFVALGTSILALTLNVIGFDGVLGCWINDSEQWKCYCIYPTNSTTTSTTISREGMTSINIYEWDGDGSYLGEDWGCYGLPSCDHQSWIYDCGDAKDQQAERCYECEVCENQSKMDAETFAVIFGVVPIGICFCFVVLSMIILYWTVWKTEQMSSRWNFGVRNNNTRGRQRRQQQQQQQQRNNNNPGQQHQNSSSNRRTTRICGRRSNVSLSQRTMETGMLYSGALVLAYLPSIFSGLLPRTSSNDRTHEAMQFLVVLLLPLQGFFNLLIYTSDRWLPVIERIKVVQCIVDLYRRLLAILNPCRGINDDDDDDDDDSDDEVEGDEEDVDTNNDQKPKTGDTRFMELSGRESTTASSVDPFNDHQLQSTGDIVCATIPSSTATGNNNNNNNFIRNSIIRLQMAAITSISRLSSSHRDSHIEVTSSSQIALDDEDNRQQQQQLETKCSVMFASEIEEKQKEIHLEGNDDDEVENVNNEENHHTCAEQQTDDSEKISEIAAVVSTLALSAMTGAQNNNVAVPVLEIIEESQFSSLADDEGSQTVDA